MLRRVMQLRCWRAPDTFIYLMVFSDIWNMVSRSVHKRCLRVSNGVFGYLKYGISKCPYWCFRISEIWYLEVSMSNTFLYWCILAILSCIQWPRTDGYYAFSDIWNMVSRSVYERYLRVSVWNICDRYFSIYGSIRIT